MKKKTQYKHVDKMLI